MLPRVMDFRAAAQRHYHDASLLHDHQRFPNADHIVGFAAECGLKAILVGFLGAHDTGRKPVSDVNGKRVNHGHLPGLWGEVRSVLAGRAPATAFAALFRGENQFGLWRAEQRYEDGTAITEGEVWVAPAGGRPREGYSYILKLNRAYLGYPHDGDRTFAGRLRTAVEHCATEVEASSRPPDVILLDSRSGIHDLAAVAITQLSDLALLFAVDNAPTWSGYRELFDQWRIDRTAASRIRDRLRMVAAMVPRFDEDGYLARFRDRAQALFAESLYDEVTADRADDVDAFNPSLTDPDAPHAPLPIQFTADLLGVDLAKTDGWPDGIVDAAFGRFVRGAADLVLDIGGGGL